MLWKARVFPGVPFVYSGLQAASPSSGSRGHGIPTPSSFSRSLLPPQCPVLSDSPHTSSAPYPLVMRFAAKGNPRCIQQGNASLLSLNRWETVSIPCGVSAFLVTAGMETEAVGLCVAAH